MLVLERRAGEPVDRPYWHHADMATDAELEWASTYNAYERVAGGPSTQLLLDVLRPGIDAYARTRRVPEWCGVDFLRAWAFYRQRELHHDGIGPVSEDFDYVLNAVRRHPAATPEDMPPHRSFLLPADWREELKETLDAPYWSHLMEFVDAERREHTVLPSEARVFRAFDLTPYEEVRVVILGQDPYPRPGDADGLAFSSEASGTPSSLKNIFKELQSDYGTRGTNSNTLTGWAEQGVLLLNTALTLRAGSRDDHDAHRKWRWQKQGWHTFTDAVISSVSNKRDPVVFMLWGEDARKKVDLIDAEKHLIIEEVHPSPLSARRVCP